MKTLLLFLATIQLTINCLGLELVKCGFIPKPASTLPASTFDRFLTNGFVNKSKSDGTSLIIFPHLGASSVVKPFKYVRYFPQNPEPEILSTRTNDYAVLNVGGEEVVTYNIETTLRFLRSNPEVIFQSLSHFGYMDIQRDRRSVSVVGVVEKGGVETRSSITNYPFSDEIVRIVKFDLRDNEKESVVISDRINVDASRGTTPQGFQTYWTSGLQKRVLLMNVTAENLDFYLVTDPDLFPDTALGSPRVEGGAATFNMTTSSEEPVEIQSSNDLKVWKRIQSLENANGRSVTLPVGSDKEFLRLVEP